MRLLLCLLWVALAAQAQPGTLVLTPQQTTPLAVGLSAYLFEDETGKLTFDDILQPSIQKRFVRSTHSIPTFANTKATIWCKFTVQNQSQEDYLLDLACAGIHYVDFYIPDQSNHFQIKSTGFLVPFHQRDYQLNTFRYKAIAANDTQPKTFYVRFRSGGTLLLSLQLGTAKAFMQQQHHYDLFYGIYFGAMLVILVLNFFIFLFVRERVYLYYVLSTLGFALFNASINIGYTFEFLWSAFPSFNYYTHSWLAFGCIFLIVFTRHFLETRQQLPLLDKGLPIIISVFLLVIGLNLVQLFRISRILLQLNALAMIVYLVTIAIISYRRGTKQARFYILGQCVFLTGAVVLSLLGANVISDNFWVHNALLVSSAVESILFSFAFADRLRILRASKKRMEEEQLDLIQNQNNRLEQLVQKRTEEIAMQNNEITAQNEELAQTQEEIAAQRDMLLRQNKKLKKAQSLIRKYNQNLETEVYNRTEDLQKANDTLIKYNLQLEQFAFITAHNLRSPVARIQGLGNLLELPNLNTEESHRVMRDLVTTAQKLDEVIKDLSFILETNNAAEPTLTQVVLEDEMNKVTYLLDDEILQSGASVSTDFSLAPTAQSQSVYIHNILYNLVSNAIKYRHPDRQAQIRIRSSKKDGFFCLMVQDNGLGIDLENYGTQLFNLYKRFHFHVNGKGMGLYLVKTQVTALGGRLEVESTVGKGTTFYVYLPV